MSEVKAYSITGVSPKHVVDVFEAQCEDFFDGNVKTECIFTTEANDDSWCVTFYRRYDGRKTTYGVLAEVQTGEGHGEWFNTLRVAERFSDAMRAYNLLVSDLTENGVKA